MLPGSNAIRYASESVNGLGRTVPLTVTELAAPMAGTVTQCRRRATTVRRLLYSDSERFMTRIHQCWGLGLLAGLGPTALSPGPVTRFRLATRRLSDILTGPVRVMDHPSRTAKVPPP